MGGLNLWITDDGAVFDFHKTDFSTKTPSTVGHVVRMRFENAQPSSMVGLQQQKTTFNYFVGKDQRSWFTKVPSFAEVRSQQIYNGVQARYYFDQGAPRYDLIVQPGADPSEIGMHFEGANVHVLPNGNLQIPTSLGPVEERGLTVYQGEGSDRENIPAKMSMEHGVVHFKVGPYDHQQPLIIDPVIFSTFLGGSTDQRALGCAMDAGGNVVLDGFTASNDFPVTTGAYQTSYPGHEVAFISKLSSDGSTLMWSTFLCGPATSNTNVSSSASCVVIDPVGNVIVGGGTSETNFPLTANAFDRTVTAGGFLSKLSSDGSTLLYSTYCVPGAVALGPNNGIYVSGTAYGAESLATTPGAYDSNGSNGGPFVFKINSDGSLAYATYVSTTPLGPNDTNTATGLAVDSAGEAYVVGTSQGGHASVSDSGYQPNIAKGKDFFISKLSANGTQLLGGTYLGGIGDESGPGITLDPYGNVVVVGSTDFAPYPTTNGAYLTTSNNDQWIVVSKLSPDLKVLLASTYVGQAWPQSNAEVSYPEGMPVSTDANGAAYLGVGIFTTNWPTTPGAYEPGAPSAAPTTVVPPNQRAVIAKLSGDLSQLLFSSYVGGSNGPGALESINGSFVTGNRVMAVAGNTSHPDFPTSAGAYQTTYKGYEDAFAAKYAISQDIIVSLSNGQPSGGSSVNGTVTLPQPAGATAVTVNLSSKKPNAASVPSGVTVPAGKSSASFTLSCSSVNVYTPVAISASGGGFRGSTMVVVHPALAVLSFSASSATGGAIIAATITIPSQNHGITLVLGSSDASAIVPNSINIPAGSTSATFNINTSPVTTDRDVVITASGGGFYGRNGFVLFAAREASAGVSPQSTPGGTPVTATVTLNGVTATDQTFKVTSSDYHAVVPASVTVPTGASSASFSVGCARVAADTVVTITIGQKSASFTIEAPHPLRIDVQTSYPQGGQTVSGWIYLDNGTTVNTAVTLSSNDPVLTVPPSVTVPAGHVSAPFTYSTSAVTSSHTVTITATCNGVSVTHVVTVHP